MKRWHDYVFRSGDFVGRFEEMYQDIADPWEQSAEGCEYRQAAIRLMKRHGIKTVLECGSGLGYYADRLKRAGFDVMGIDVSATAVARAQSLFPDIPFAVGDLEQVARRSFDAVVFAELSWYVLPRLNQALRTMQSRYLVHLLTFYPPGRQEYGREYFTTFDEFIAWCPLELVDSWTEVVEDHHKTVAIFTHPSSQDSN